MVTSSLKMKSVSSLVLHYCTHVFFVGGAAVGGVCARVRACMHTYPPHCVETGKTKEGQVSNAVSSFLGEHLSGEVTA